MAKGTVSRKFGYLVEAKLVAVNIDELTMIKKVLSCVRVSSLTVNVLQDDKIAALVQGATLHEFISSGAPKVKRESVLSEEKRTAVRESLGNWRAEMKQILASQEKAKEKEASDKAAQEAVIAEKQADESDAKEVNTNDSESN